ncbi:GNAT family N-acetyltransferase [Bacillus sp. JCM 19034]|uniref:GNAT family N-acetyltransferase n=1 Tax=Bacillus sp. JCM 19034 TaxID=1481928 RepID=UPI000B15F8D3|nr:GNAT family N-acetyltransferase [Bacillus sp. JCM 19034]
MILKQRDVAECHVLFELLTDPAVYPYVREKAQSYDEYVFLTKQMIEAEERGELISRTIVDEWGSPIGTITLYDIDDHTGFLGTWLGTPYFGRGYNKQAKDAFFQELFFNYDIQTVFMRIRKHNDRSYNAALKLPYCTLANDLRPDIYTALNQKGDYNLFQIEKDLYYLHFMRSTPSIERKEA